jgi:preprotein translocase subunit SecD
MKKATIRIASLTPFLLLLASACSRIALDPSKPHFTIAARDLAAPVVLATNSSPTGANATIVVQIQFTAAKAKAFRAFTRQHLNQQTQLVVGSKVVAEPTILAEIPDGRVDIAFSSFEDALAVRDALNKK